MLASLYFLYGVVHQWQNNIFLEICLEIKGILGVAFIHGFTLNNILSSESSTTQKHTIT